MTWGTLQENNGGANVSVWWHCRCHQHWQCIQIKYVHWIYSFLVMIEVEKCWNPSQYCKPFVTDFIKETEKTVSIQTTTQPQTRSSLPMMQFKERSNNLLYFPSLSLCFTFSMRSRGLDTSYLEMHSVLSIAVSASEFWSLITTESLCCHRIVSETVSQGSF